MISYSYHSVEQLLELSYLYPSYSFNESCETMYAAVLL